MSRTNPFSMHRQSVWAERAGDPQFPDWLRVAAIAYGKHRANGHANFSRGALRVVLSTVNRETGEIHDNENVSRAIATAVRYGFLAKGSNARCLVVPQHAVEGGLENAFSTCVIHGPSQSVTRK